MAASSLEQFLENYRDTIDRLYSTSNAAAWHVSRSSFASALWRSFDRRFDADASAVNRADALSFLDSIHAADLALAIGCRDGDADAWRHLVATYRAPVDAFARAVLGNSSRASEIADSLWADLYGLRSLQRRSPLSPRSLRRPQLADVVDASSSHPSRSRSMARDPPHGTARRRARQQFEPHRQRNRFARSRSRKADRGARSISQCRSECAVAGRPAAALILLCARSDSRADCGSARRA